MATKYRYEEFTWPEIREAVAQNRVAVLPVGTIEQHGPHLPLVADVITATEMSRLAVAGMPEEAVLLPSVYYAFNEHHMDFPGTIAVQGDTFISYISEVPVWKATYRVVLSSKSGQKPLLQGWAIVDNTVGQDWENVQLSLVAGAPQSFIQNYPESFAAVLFAASSSPAAAEFKFVAADL